MLDMNYKLQVVFGLIFYWLIDCLIDWLDIMSATCIFVLVNYLWQIIFQIIICNWMIFNCWLIYIFSFILWITYTYVIVYACLFLVIILVLRRKICVDCIHCTFFIIIPLMNVSDCFNSFGVFSMSYIFHTFMNAIILSW